MVVFRQSSFLSQNSRPELFYKENTRVGLILDHTHHFSNGPPLKKKKGRLKTNSKFWEGLPCKLNFRLLHCSVSQLDKLFDTIVKLNACYSKYKMLAEGAAGAPRRNGDLSGIYRR